MSRQIRGSLFLSHSHVDRRFAERIAKDLEGHGIRVWMDEAEMMIGDSLIEKISQAINEVDYVGVLLSKRSVRSRWVMKEVAMAIMLEISGKRLRVLPLLLEDCTIPIFLRDKIYADFRNPEEYDKELSRVLKRVVPSEVLEYTGSLLEKYSEAVLMIYVGGEVFSVHSDPSDPRSPFVQATWEQLRETVPPLEQATKEFEFRVDVREFSPPLDSSNVGIDDWLAIARVVRDNYEKYDGFVILHGTDTMTYTATALSFILENLSKPVIITGSQLPIGAVRTDAIQNLITALEIAAAKSTKLPVVPEVCIFFKDLLLRGNRTRKMSSSGYQAFESPNYPALGRVNESIVMNGSLIRKPSKKAFFMHETLNRGVLSIELFPGMGPEVLRSVFHTPGLRGVVLKTWGAGNAPTTRRFLDTIEDAVKRGIVVVDVTQCPRGAVELGLYEASAGLLKRGVVSGVDMTPEAALCKLSHLLELGYSFKDVCRYVQLDQRGEQSMNIYDIAYETGKAAPASRMEPQVIPGGLERAKIERATIRVQDLRLDKSEGPTEFTVRAFVNLPSLSRNTPDNVPQYVGSATVRWQEKPLDLFFDATKTVLTVFDPRHPALVSLITDREEISWRNLVLSIWARV